MHRLKHKQALVLKQGCVRLNVQADDGMYTQVLLGAATTWDSFAIPADHWRSLHNEGSEDALMLLLTRRFNCVLARSLRLQQHAFILRRHRRLRVWLLLDLNLRVVLARAG